MFRPNYSPQGLFVKEGVEYVKLDTCSDDYGNFYMQPNGVFYLTNNGTPGICKTSDYYNTKNVNYATQSGPLLVAEGEINSKFSKNSKNLHYRSGIGYNGNAVVFIISNELVSFYELASIFYNKYKCNYALYLDGAISDAFITALDRKAKDINYGSLILVTKK